MTRYYTVDQLYTQATGEPLTIQHKCRMIHDGIHGVRLDARKIANKWMTTEEALEAFFRDSTAARIASVRPSTPTKPRSEVRKSKAYLKAESDLAKLGI